MSKRDIKCSECEYGHISQIDTDKCDKYICHKCGSKMEVKNE